MHLTRSTVDTTGEAEVGLYGSTTIIGHWWRMAADSIRVDAGGPFDAVWLRLDDSRDIISGTVAIFTDGDMTPRKVPLLSWTGTRGRCPQR